MNCECGGKLEVTHTFPAGQHAQARDYKCPVCGLKKTSVTFIVRDRKQTGSAKTVAKRIELGTFRMPTNADPDRPV